MFKVNVLSKDLNNNLANYMVLKELSFAGECSDEACS
jgi:hypothetical protein